VLAVHGEMIAVGLDVRVVEHADGTVQHRLAARGGIRDRGDLWAALERLDQDGCARYVVTDVSRDGMLRGPNVDLYREVTRATSAPVIASGGISAIEDLVALAGLAAAGANLEGSIVGKALYAGRFTLPEALEAVRRTA
jgi:phosphoribosyl isomerase A